VRMKKLKAKAGRLSFTFYLLLLAGCLFSARPCSAQEVVDKMVASINSRELITYSDLLWQLALQPDTPLDNPRSDDLNRALQLLIDQRLIAQEAEKLPTIAPKDEDIDKAITDLLSRFPSKMEFYQRIGRVGLSADQLREILRQRLAIENYIDFRFRSFTFVSPQEAQNYYNEVYVPRLRRQMPGRIVPTFDEARQTIEKTLANSKIESDIDAFLEDARTRADIVILNPV